MVVDLQSRSWRGVLDTQLCDIVCQVDGFLQVLRFPPPITTDCHDITEILLKVALSTVTLTLKLTEKKYCCFF